MGRGRSRCGKGCDKVGKGLRGCVRLIDVRRMEAEAQRCFMCMCNVNDCSLDTVLKEDLQISTQLLRSTDEEESRM